MRVIPGADLGHHGELTELADLAGEVVRLRTSLVEERAASVRALARATRLSQLVTALGQVVDVSEVFERAVCEVTELFGADIAAVFTPADGSPADGFPADGFPLEDDGQWRLIASWGLGDDPPGVCAPLGSANRPTPASPVVAGAATGFDIPDWLRAYDPVHLTWGLLTVRGEQPGYLLLVRRADQPFDNADVHELAAVVSRIALAVDNGRLYQRTQEQLRHSQLLHEVTAALSRCPDPDAVAARLAEAVVSAPAAGSGAQDFLQHLTEVGGLAMDRARMVERLRRQAETDALTGLPNRALFRQRLGAAVDRCRVSGTALTVLFIDLDGFKAVNDTHGHEAGDRLLVEVAGRLTTALGAGPGGFCARLGGDEFVVLLEGDGDPEPFRHVMDEPFTLATPTGPVRLRAGGSMGAGTAATSGYDADALLRDADAAMYAAKRARATA
jgi:diguanylate cyclase (GGDEF)-like protein